MAQGMTPGGERVKSPDTVKGAEPSTPEPDPTQLKDDMRKVSQSPSDPTQSRSGPDDDKRKAARGEERENSAGA